jgi:hypothetical protein
MLWSIVFGEHLAQEIVLARPQLCDIDLHLCRVRSSEFLNNSHVVSLLIFLEL